MGLFSPLQTLEEVSILRLDSWTYILMMPCKVTVAALGCMGEL
jgi:hypothetical protein